MRVDHLTGRAPLSEREALMVSPLRLAYIGDSVYDLYVRTTLLFSGENVRAMHQGAIGTVNAGAQAQALSRVMSQLTETESDVVKRGRNAHAHHGVPRRSNPADYSQATGFEALLGFLYLTGQMDRLQAIYEAINRKEESE